MWICTFAEGGKKSFVFDNDIESVWKDSGYKDLLLGMSEKEVVNLSDKPIHVRTTLQKRGRDEWVRVSEVHADFYIAPYHFAARHARILANLLTEDRSDDESQGAEEGGRLHCWGLVARIYREFQVGFWSEQDETENYPGIAAMIDYLWSGIDNAITDRALIAIINLVYGEWAADVQWEPAGLPLEDDVWVAALADWRKSPRKEDFVTFTGGML